MIKKRNFPIVLIILILLSNIPVILNDEISERSQITKNVTLNNAPVKPAFIYGVSAGPVYIDPHNAWDRASFDVITQVFETLYTYNLSDPTFPMIPQLAADFGTWAGPNPDGTWNYTIPLVSNGLFHDGCPFNAFAVKFSFDRLHYFIESDLAQIRSLYKYHDLSDGSEKLIINRTEVLGDYSVRFVLNDKYVPFEALLTFPGSSILSPLSTPLYNFIDTNTGDILGTGPFMYDGYNPGIQVDFRANEYYRKGKADIDFMTFKVISDTNARNMALLTGTVDFIRTPSESYWSSFEADPNIILLDSGVTDMVGYYLGMNNYWINSTFRKAISYAINYTHIIDTLTNGRVKRLDSIIPEGVLYSNSSFDAAECNITKARMIMQSMGYGGGLDPTYPGTHEDSWTSAIFKSYNYTYYSSSGLSAGLLGALTNYLDLIGIQVTDANIAWFEFIDILNEQSGRKKTELQLFYFAWGADFNDPSNFINVLTSNRTGFTEFNGVMYNGYLSAIEGGRNPFDINDNAQLLMDAALFESNTELRKGMYDRLQELLVEEDMPYAYLVSPRQLHAYDSDLSGFMQNPMRILDFYSCNWSVAPVGIPITILIDDSLPEYNWSKTAAENDWCTGSGTWADPYIIKDIDINGNGVNDSIVIRNSNAFFKIKNCTIHGGRFFGLKLSNVSNSVIFNLSVYNNVEVGVYLENSNNHTIQDIKVWDTSTGPGICIIDSNHTRLINNTVTTSGWGIVGINNVYNTQVIDNKLNNNNRGIVLFDTHNTIIEQNVIMNNYEFGIVIMQNDDSIIKNNSILNNGDYGLIVYSPIGIISFNNTIFFNLIYSHDIAGIVLQTGANQNKVFYNVFIDNLINAIDDGSLNSWDNGTIGNFWDDYIGVDADDDGIGDTPYLIYGLAGSMDNFPIYDDGPEDYSLAITIIQPISNGVYGTNAPSFSISITGIYLDTTWYSLDSGVTNITFSGLTGTFDQAEWDKLPDGSHTIRFYANNTNGQVYFTEVTITKDTTQTTTTPEIPGMNLFLVIPIILVAIISWGLRFKKKFK